MMQYEVFDFEGESVGLFPQKAYARAYLDGVWDGYGKIVEREEVPNLDPEPWVSHHGRHEDTDPAGWDFDVHFTFAPRPGYSQNIEDYR